MDTQSMNTLPGGGLSVLCVLPRERDSRIARRIDMLKKAGFTVEAVSFEREQDVGRLPDCGVESLGHIRHGRYAERIFKLLRAVPAIRRAARRNDAIYAFNCDLAFVSLLSAFGIGRPVVLETADIMGIQVTEGLYGRAVRGLDRIAVEGCSLLVLTTTGYREYYRDWLSSSKDALIIENKIDSAFAASVRNIPEEPVTGLEVSDSECAYTKTPMRIGWFGILRDEWSWRVLENLIAERSSEHTVVLAGVGMLDRFSERVIRHPAINYMGEYAHPQGLQEIYSSVDLVMACYPPVIPFGWSQSNRYYEACLFGKPLIVRAGCADAERVKRLDIGLVIDTSIAEEAATAIRAVTAQDMNRWRSNMASLPTSAYAVTDEAFVLGKAIADIARPITARGVGDGD